MPEKQDIRAYLNPYPPRFSKEAQAAQLSGQVYTEDKSGMMIEALIKSVRPGSVVAIVETFLLAPTKGRTGTRRAALVDRIDRIEGRGGVVRELSTGNETSSRKQHRAMLLRAYEMISRSGMGQPGKRKTGRPKYDFTAHEWSIMEGQWHSSRNKNNDERIAGMAKRMTKKPLGATALRNKFGPPGERNAAVAQ